MNVFEPIFHFPTVVAGLLLNGVQTEVWGCKMSFFKPLFFWRQLQQIFLLSSPSSRPLVARIPPNIILFKKIIQFFPNVSVELTFLEGCCLKIVLSTEMLQTTCWRKGLHKKETAYIQPNVIDTDLNDPPSFSSKAFVFSNHLLGNSSLNFLTLISSDSDENVPQVPFLNSNYQDNICITFLARTPHVQQTMNSCSLLLLSWYHFRWMPF